jgi:nicotinate-nucleotide pyrophosphorylase (carboxylating)
MTAAGDCWDDPETLTEVIGVVDSALREDLKGGDITSEALFPADHRSEAAVLIREQGVVAGIPIFRMVYQRLWGGAVCQPEVNDGEVGLLTRSTGTRFSFLTRERRRPAFAHSKNMR